MFYLRIVSKGQVQNICLGNCYRKVTSDFECHENWVRIPREQHPFCGMFIYPEYESDPIPIYERFGGNYYIVTENGNTYERLYPNDILFEKDNDPNSGLKLKCNRPKSIKCKE